MKNLKSIDFNNHKELEKLQNDRAMKWIELYLKAAKGDKKAIEEIEKHEEEDRKISKSAQEAGFMWM